MDVPLTLNVLYIETGQPVETKRTPSTDQWPVLLVDETKLRKRAGWEQEALP